MSAVKIVDLKDLISVEHMPITSRRCEVSVSDNVCREHMRRRLEDPSRCQAYAKCVVGDRVMCYKHAQQYVFNSLLNNDVFLIRKKKS